MRRTATEGSPVGFGIIVLLLAFGIIEWIHGSTREDTFHSHLGHI